MNDKKKKIIIIIIITFFLTQLLEVVFFNNTSVKAETLSSSQGKNEKIYMYDKIESDGSNSIASALKFFKEKNEDVYIKLKVGTNTSTNSKKNIIKKTVDMVNSQNMQSKVYYTSSDKELLKLIKNYNANVNFNYEINNWNWNGSDSIVAFINSLKNSNNKVSAEINGAIYKDTIAQTLKYNGIKMIVKVYSLNQISKIDKSVHKIIILDEKISNNSVYEYVNALTEHFYDYTAVNPSDAVNYQILAKDNCGVMFQTIQNTENSNVWLYTNNPKKDESLFRFKRVSENQYMIINKKNSLAISAKDYNNNSKLILVKQNKADKKQIWKIVHNSNGTASFVNVATGKAIQPEQSTQKLKYNLIQSTYVKNKTAQSFYLYSDEVRIQTSSIRVYIPNNNSEIDKIDFSYSVNKKIAEKDVIEKTKNEIYNEVKKKLTSIGLKEGQYKINIWKDNSHSIADDLVHYYIRVNYLFPENLLEKNPDNYTKVDPSEVVNYKILSKDNPNIMFQNAQNNVSSNIRLYMNIPAKDENLYRFKKISNTGYMIISKRNSLAISAKDYNNNSKLILVKQNQADKKQIWKIVHNSNGTASFVNVATGKAIQPEQSTQKLKYNLIQSTYVKNKTAQSFYLYSDEVRIQTSSIRVYIPNNNSEIDKIDFSYSVNKKIAEKDVIEKTKNEIFNEIKKKLTSIGLKEGQYKIYLWKDNSHSIADDSLHYYIKVELNIQDFPSTDYVVEALTHRGYKTAPELTRPAYWMARLNGFHYSGADIRVTKDGIPVLYHDPNLVRTARTANGGTVSSNIRIENLTYAEAMKYDYGLYKSSAWKGTQLTTLDQYIKLCKQLGLVTNLHLKPNYSNLNKANLQKIVNIVNKYDMRENVYYASEEKSYLTIIKSLDKDANFDFLLLKEWNWEGENSIVAYLETLKSPKNRVEIALSKNIYQDAIAKTMEFNGFRMTISGDSPKEILSEDKSIDVISTDKMEPTDIQKYALQRKDRIGKYIKTNPKEQTYYNMLAKDNCGVMFQTIQNTANSNVRLYSNPDIDESKFRFKKVSNDGYMIISKKNSLAISAKDYNKNSKLIITKQNQNDKKQIWKILHNGNGTVTFVNVATWKAIQPEQSTQKKGYILIQSTYNKTKNAQQFFLK